MSSPTPITPSSEFRKTLRRRGAETASRCYQCATCSSVCQLAPEDNPFPRKQMLAAQWGLTEQLVSDPAVWLCHQCNDCTTRCPRDAKPGDVMQSVRSIMVERLAAPLFMGKLVGNAKFTWWLLLGVPLVYWIIVLYVVNGLAPNEWPSPTVGYDVFVPHWLIYATFFTVTGLVLIATLLSGFRFWKILGDRQQRSGSFIGAALSTAIEIATHSRFGKCETSVSRRVGHFALFWGFVGAAGASGLLIVAMYFMNEEMPLPLGHPFKVIGNIAAVLLVAGAGMIFVNRLKKDDALGKSTSFDNFFFSVVLLVIVSGVLTEVARFLFQPIVATWVYIIHLASVLCLFATFPYSKFAHFLYRTLAMVHEKMAGPKGKQ